MSYLKYTSLYCFIVLSFFVLQCFASVVAVIDTGVDIHHPWIHDRLWVNTKEIPQNGIDDDSNGYIDDVHGWNFDQNNSLITDFHGHGTHISGLIAQKSKSAKIMVLKYFNPQSSPEKNLESTIKAIEYATKMGAQVINYSAGGPGYNQREFDVIKNAADKNILFIAAAGNDSKNTDVKKYYPANYNLKNIISVMSVNSNQQASTFSNFGSESVDIAAIGEELLSSTPGKHVKVMSGTSQATALTSATAADLFSSHPEILFEEVSVAIKLSGQTAPALEGKSKYAKILNQNILPKFISKKRQAASESIQDQWLYTNSK